jgi:Domain of Unknown Function with PDB structure (DUF3857)
MIRCCAACRCAVLALATVWGVALAAPSRAAHAWSPLPGDVWQQQARPDSGGRDAIVVLEEGDVEDRDDTYEYHLFRRIRIFTEHGRDAGTVDIDYLKGYAKLSDVRARSIRPDGATTELAEDQILNSTIFKAGNLEFNRATFIVPGIEPGCVIEYGYTLKGKYESIWNWPWYFQNLYYTRESRFRWRPSKNTAINHLKPLWILKKIPDPFVARSCDPDCDDPNDIVFTVCSLPGWQAEEWAPPLQDAGPRVITSYVPVQMSVLDFWSLWKRHLDDIASGFSRKMGAFEKVVDAAKARHSEPDDALADVYHWLQGHVRSTSERGWRERQTGTSGGFWGREVSVADLVRRGQGSPYEINLAFSAAAIRLGLESCVVLVRDRREGGFDHEVVGFIPTESLTAVRHPGERRWTFYDPASRFELFGNVPWYLRGGSGLVAGPGRELIVWVPPEAGAGGDALWTLDLTLADDGTLEGHVGAALRGEQGRAARGWLWNEDPERWVELVNDWLSADKKPELAMNAPDVNGAPDSAFILTGAAKYPLITSMAGAMTTLPIEHVAPWRFTGAFRQASRTQPIQFRFARNETLVVDLHLPESESLEALPHDRKFENEVGSWSTSWSLIPGGVRLRRTVAVPEAEIPPRYYAPVRDFFAGLDEADHEVLLIKRAP